MIFQEIKDKNLDRMLWAYSDYPAADTNQKNDTWRKTLSNKIVSFIVVSFLVCNFDDWWRCLSKLGANLRRTAMQCIHTLVYIDILHVYLLQST